VHPTCGKGFGNLPYIMEILTKSPPRQHGKPQCPSGSMKLLSAPEARRLLLLQECLFIPTLEEMSDWKEASKEASGKRRQEKQKQKRERS
jgi:hypothetical protein